MSDRQTSLARRGLLALPCLAVCLYAFAHRPVVKARAAGYGNAIMWQCRTSYRPDIAVFDTPRFAIALPSPGKTSQGDAALTITVSTPQKIRWEMSPATPGFDIRYAKRVDTVTLGGRSFEILDDANLRVEGRTIPLLQPKPYVTVTRSGKVVYTTTPPKWYEDASRAGFWSQAPSLQVETWPVHSLLPDNLNARVWPGRALSTPSLLAVDCPKFAVAAQSAPAQKQAAPRAPFVSHLDIQVGGKSGLSACVNGVREDYSQGVASFTLGKAAFRLIDDGSLLQTPGQPIPLDGPKKYVTIAPDGAVTASDRKPAWFAPFDRAPADPPHPRYTVAAE